MHTVHVRDPGDLIAGIPALFGFIPNRSLIVLGFLRSSPSINVAMRLDVVIDDADQPAPTFWDAVNHLDSVAIRHRLDAVILVVVDDRLPVNDRGWSEFVAAATECLDGTTIIAVLSVASVESGQRWRSHTASAYPRTSGILTDPRSTPLAVAQAVVNGRQIRSTRDQMVGELVPGRHCDDAVCKAGTRRGDIVTDEAALLRLSLSVIATYHDGLSCETVEMMDSAVRCIRVRDCLLTLSSSVVAADAHVMWGELARRLYGTGRAAAATLLGYSYYTRGDGAMAGIALDAANEAEAGYSLAQLLGRALSMAVPPEDLRPVVSTGQVIAHELGVMLPPDAQMNFPRGA